MADARELLTAYQDALKGLRRGVGPAGVFVAPLQLGADVLDLLLQRQQTLETQVGDVRKQLETLYELARDTPATLRSQSKAFGAAAVALQQAADVMEAQAELLDRTGAVIKGPARRARRPAKPK